jgi:hypothetical protein
MAPQTSTPWRSRAATAAVLLLGALSASRGVAQTPGAEVHYTSKPSFRIPFTTDDGGARIAKVLLYVSDDLGKSYKYVATNGPTSKYFEFNAKGDGWYWFTVQTEDADRRRFPADASLFQPNLRVCIDSRPPVVTLAAANAGDNPIGVSWTIRDDDFGSGPDLNTMRLEYRERGGLDWTPLNAPLVASGDCGWTPSVNAPDYEVRLTVRDKAGNLGTGRTIVVPGMGGRRRNDPSPAAAAIPSDVRLVNQKRIKLSFDVDNLGPSKLSAVEIWVTNDANARQWRLYKTEKNTEGPYYIDVTDEGRYGITLVAVSGVGQHVDKPQAGDQPQVWVQVDLTKPVVQMQVPEVGRGPNEGNLTIRWLATDAHLGTDPITLSYEKSEGNWEKIATNLPNNGIYVWKMPPETERPYMFNVRVEAIDLAGNLGSDETKKKVIVDLKVPKTRLKSIEPVSEADRSQSSPNSLP